MNKLLLLFFLISGLTFAQPIQTSEEKILEAINQKQIQLLQVQIEELKASSSNPLAN